MVASPGAIGSAWLRLSAWWSHEHQWTPVSEYGVVRGMVDDRYQVEQCACGAERATPLGSRWIGNGE